MLGAITDAVGKTDEPGVGDCGEAACDEVDCDDAAFDEVWGQITGYSRTVELERILSRHHIPYS